MRLTGLTAAGAALATATAITLPAGASAKTTSHKCPNITYDGLTASQIVVTGVTCGFVRQFAHDYLAGRLPKGWTIRQLHPATSEGRDLAVDGAKHFTFYISGHFKPDQD